MTAPRVGRARLNEPALSFYRGLGARTLDDWRTLRLDGPKLRALAS